MAFDPILVLFFVLILAAPFLICSALLLGLRPFRDVWPFQSRLILPPRTANGNSDQLGLARRCAS